ncbi:uromodulin-like [Pocillopora verrucosa]|uniref:uromodulin-like n=1 Tax=Pocillopora verrucosa TaxID=203993 RepID=UPI00334147A8
MESMNACKNKPCPRNAICQAGFSSEGYRCVCVPGYTGEDCTEDVDECNLGENKCDSNAECINTRGSYDCKCKEGFIGDGLTCTANGCYNYSTLRDAKRKSTYETPRYSEGVCDNWLSEGWYRFEGAAGTKMPTTSVDDYHCNTVFSGWLNGAEPTVGDGEVFRTVCFTRGADTCKHSITIVMKNCGSYFIYKLVPPPAYNYRYCGTD